MNRVDPCATCKKKSFCGLSQKLYNAESTRYNAWEVDRIIFSHPIRTDVEFISRNEDGFKIKFRCNDFEKQEQEKMRGQTLFNQWAELHKAELEAARAGESAALEEVARLQEELDVALSGESAALEALAKEVSSDD